MLNTSQDFWPADFGHYGGLMIRLSWHAAGTYRIEDGRGGAGDGGQRFAPLNSWPDNANLDKARRLLWPVKQKYGQKVSWADLLVLAGNVALEDMGFETFGFGFGREDVWEPEEVFWGPEDTWLGDERYSGDRELAEGAGRGPDGPHLRQPGGPQRRARPAQGGPRHPRDLPPDGDERRGDGRADRRRPLVRQDPRRRRRRPGRPRARGLPAGGHGPRLDEQPRLRQGRGRHHLRAGGHLDRHARPGGATASSTTSSATSGSSRRARPGPTSGSPRTPRRPSPTRSTPAGSTSRAMLTTDLALRMDPEYEKISRRFHADLDEFRLAFAKAWYKLLHRDMGPVDRYLGPWVAEPQLWQDPVPAADRPADLGRGRRRASRPRSWSPACPRRDLVRTAWAQRGDVPPHRQARWRQRRPDPPRAAARLGGQRRRRPGPREARVDPGRVQRRRAGRRCPWPT